MRIVKIPVRNQLNIGQMRGFIQGSGKKVGCHHQREMARGRRPGKPITGPGRKNIETPGAMLCPSRVSFRRPFTLSPSRSLEIQHVSRMLVLGNGAGGYIVERFHCDTLPCHMPT